MSSFTAKFGTEIKSQDDFLLRLGHFKEMELTQTHCAFRKPLFPSASASAASPVNHVSQESPAMAANLEEARLEVGKMLDASAEGMNPFRLLYNLEVISSRLIPSPSSVYSSEQSEQFVSDFLDAGGIGLVFKALERDSLPADVNVHTRQNIYLVALQLADFLLSSNASSAAAEQEKKQTPSPTIKPTPPKRSALDDSAKAGVPSKAPAASAAMGILRDMGEAEFSEVLSSLVRVAWAMASGNTPLSSTSILKVGLSQFLKFRNCESCSLK